MVAIGSAAHMGSAITPKRGYSGQNSRRRGRCQSEVDLSRCVYPLRGAPSGGRVLVLRTEPRQAGARPLRASIPVAETANTALYAPHLRSAVPAPSHSRSPCSYSAWHSVRRHRERRRSPVRIRTARCCHAGNPSPFGKIGALPVLRDISHCHGDQRCETTSTSTTSKPSYATARSTAPTTRSGSRSCPPTKSPSDSPKRIRTTLWSEPSPSAAKDRSTPEPRATRRPVPFRGGPRSRFRHPGRLHLAPEHR